MPDNHQSKPFANLARHTPVSELIRELLPDIDDPPVDPTVQAQLAEFWREEAGIDPSNLSPEMAQHMLDSYLQAL